METETLTSMDLAILKAKEAPTDVLRKVLAVYADPNTSTAGNYIEPCDGDPGVTMKEWLKLVNAEFEGPAEVKAKKPKKVKEEVVEVVSEPKDEFPIPIDMSSFGVPREREPRPISLPVRYETESLLFWPECEKWEPA